MPPSPGPPKAQNSSVHASFKTKTLEDLAPGASKDKGVSNATSPLAPVPSSSFYSTTTRSNSRWTSKLESLRKAHAQQQSGAKEGSQFFVWKIFTTQDRAFRYCDGRRSEGFNVWAVENDKTTGGRRRYLVCRKDDFWSRYKTMPQEDRHYYEIVREQAPCRLYFDLEYSTDINFLRNGPQMVRNFIAFMLAKIKQTYGIVATEADVVQLDSSTPQKFSRHLIFHLPNAAFRNNAHAGEFVKDCCAALEQDIKLMGEDEAAILSPMVKDEKGHDSLFVDQSVYSRNRNFRLVWSSKVGKKARFDVAEENKFPMRRPDELGFLLDTMASFVSHSPSLRILDYRSKEAKRKGTFIPRAPRSAEDDDRFILEARSPFPDIDKFVTRQIASRPGPKGRIKTALYFPDAGTIVYTIEGNKYCDAIGREHKSNGTYCYLKLATGSLFFKCYDADCKRVGSRVDVPSLLLQPEQEEPNENVDPAAHEDDLIPDDQLMQLIEQDSSQQWF